MATNTWNAAAAGGWNTAGNWSLGHVPLSTEDVVFDATSTANCTIDTNTASINDFTIADAYTGQITFAATKYVFANGNIYLGTGATIVSPAGTGFISTPTSQKTYESNTHSIGYLGFQGTGGTTQQDAITCTFFSVSATNSYDQNGQTITVTTFQNMSAQAVYDGTITISGAPTISTAPSDMSGATLHLTGDGITVNITTTTISRLVLDSGNQYNFTSSATNVLTISTYTSGDWNGAILRSTSGTIGFHISAPASVVVEDMDVSGCENDGTTIDATDSSNTDNGRNVGWTFPSTGDTVYAPAIASLTPQRANIAGGKTGVLAGRKFGSTAGTLGSGATAITVLSWSDTQATFTFPALAVGDHSILITGSNGETDSITATYYDPDTYSDPIRSRIRKAAIYGLKQINPDNGYLTDIKHVFDPPRDMTNIREYPAVNVFTDDETCSNVADVKLEGNEGLLHNQMILRMDCYLNDINNPALEQDKVLADVQKYFGTNYKIPDSDGDSTCHECYYDSCDPWGTERTVPNCGMTVRFRVWYRQKRTNPAAMTG